MRKIRFLSSQPITVGYLTDLEGDYDYWLKYLQNSSIFEYEKTGPHPYKRKTGMNYLGQSPNHRISLKENCHFVFGGDICDRGPGDLRLLIDFLNLKRKYPDRVHFILGNRDVNKLRLFFSLQPQEILNHHPPEVYWLHNNPELREQARKEVIPGDVVSKLQWILARTMGAPSAFAHRREELKDLNLPHHDAAVAQSFLDCLSPHEGGGGLLWRYLREGTIAKRFGDCLFVHGAIHENNLGYLPPRRAHYITERSSSLLVYPYQRLEVEEEKRELDLSRWIDQINDFAHREVEDFGYHAAVHLESQRERRGENSRADPSDYLWEMKGGYHSHQPGSRLIQYGMGGLPGRQLNHTVIYTSYLQGGAKLKYPSPTVSSWLKQNEIFRVIVGHQPNGDCPWILNAHDIQTISADTAYSNNVQWPHSVLSSSSSTSPLPPAPATGSLEDYESYAAYCNKKGDASSFPSPTTYGQRVSTRSPFAHNEILLTFPDGIEPGKRSEVKVSGRLSDRSSFSFELKSRDEENHSGFIGMKTKEDWFVKAANVKREGRGDEKSYFLMSKTAEGFRFLNRLVDHQQLLSELYEQ